MEALAVPAARAGKLGYAASNRHDTIFAVHNFTGPPRRWGVDWMMGEFEWTEAMSVGVAALDADHRSLFQIVDMLREMQGEADCGETLTRLLGTLELYGRNHFRREEEVMRAVGFPGFEFHRAEHRGFGRYIEVLQRRAKAGGDAELAATLFEYLSVWLRHHILIQDMAFKPYVLTADNAEGVALRAAPPLPDDAGIRLNG